MKLTWGKISCAVTDRRSAIRWRTIARDARALSQRSGPASRTRHTQWFVTWDDHEVDNDYADDTSEENDEPGVSGTTAPVRTAPTIEQPRAAAEPHDAIWTVSASVHGAQLLVRS